MKHGLGFGLGRMRRGRSRWTSALAVLALAAAAGAADFTYTVSTGTPATVTITGYSGSGGAVAIPPTLDSKPVTGIGDRAFYYHSSLTRITLPDGITSIGDRAFYYCTGLTTILIPNSVTEIGGRAFYHCSALTSVVIGAGVSSIGGYAFASCTSLTDAYFRGDAPSLGPSVFDRDETATVYYAPEAGGWSATYGGLPTAAWPSPTVSAISPTHAASAGGTRVMITGANLTAATGVQFGTVAATAFTVYSATQIMATAPKGTAGQTVDVSVSTPGGNTINTAADDYTYNAVVITDVSSPTPNGIYGPGATIAVRLTFSEKVTVTGLPKLTLETGSTDALATYTSGSGTVTLIFSYSVTTGDASADLDCIGTDALARHDGSIRNASGDEALLTLPAPGSTHSLSANKALVVAAAGAPNGPFLAHVEAADVAAGHGLWDLSGAYALSVGGNDLTLHLVHDPRGMLTGTATLWVNTGKARMPLALTCRGKASGSSGTVVVPLRLQGAGAATGMSATLALNLALDAITPQLRGSVTGSLTSNGSTTPINEMLTLALPASMTGTWSLLFELQQGARGSGGTATLTLSNGVTHRCALYGKAAGSTAVLNLTGRASDPLAAAIGMRTTIETLVGGLTGLLEFSGRAYGQTLAWP